MLALHHANLQGLKCHQALPWVPAISGLRNSVICLSDFVQIHHMAALCAAQARRCRPPVLICFSSLSQWCFIPSSFPNVPLRRQRLGLCLSHLPAPCCGSAGPLRVTCLSRSPSSMNYQTNVLITQLFTLNF